MDFTNVDLNMFGPKYISGELVYDLRYSIEVIFGAQNVKPFHKVKPSEIRLSISQRQKITDQHMRTLVRTASPATKILPHCEKNVYDKVLRFRLGRLTISK
jgi:hypothetical protein